MSLSFGISPSALARYFFHDCDRFLRYRSTRSPSKNGVPERRYDSGPAMKAVLATGQKWEEEIIETYLRGNVSIAEGKGQISDRVWSVDDSVEQLRDAPEGQFLYQLTFRAPSSFYSALNLDRQMVEIMDNRPDLVQLVSNGNQGRLFRIIDIKRGASMRLPYRIQVLFYALELEHVLHEHGIGGTVDTSTGAAWLGGSAQMETFEFSAVRPHLEALFERLPTIFSEPADAIDWHLCYRCEWCEYLDHCYNETVGSNNVSRLVGISAHGKRFLSRNLGVRTLPELKKALKAPDADKQLELCASLAGERPRLEARLVAHEENSPHLFGNLHPALPVGENIAVFLTVQTEPVEDRTWLLGMLIQTREDLRQKLFQEEQKIRPFVVIAKKRSQCASIRTRFVKRLYQVLYRIDIYNSNQTEWKDKLSVQIYCYCDQEKKRLIRLLLEEICNPELANKSMAILFHLQAPDLLLIDDHPQDVLPHSLISLVSAAGRLLALPVDVAYTLPESLYALGSNFKYPRNERFHFPFGHGIKPDDLLRIWHGENIEAGKLLHEAAHRLFAYRAVLRDLRRHAKEQLFAWPPKHKLADSANIAHPRLSRLAFLARYESVLGCQSVRAERCEARDLMAAKGKLVPMVHEGSSRFRITVPGIVLDSCTFTRWLFVRDTNEGLRTQAKFNDWAHRNRFWGGGQDPNIGIGCIDTVDEDDLGFARAIQVRWDRPHRPPLEEGAPLLLMPRFLDFNSDKILAALVRIDNRGGLFVRLLDDPCAAAEPMDLPAEVEVLLDCYLPSLGLTPSQEEAWQSVSKHRATAVWGPPGTGKTHFLAMLVLGMCRAHQNTGQSFRVLVTAMTHTAIENVLRKIAKYARTMNWQTSAMGKTVAWQSDFDCAVEVIDKNRVDGWLEDNIVSVLGSTVWGLANSESRFDLILIDEASQMKVPEAALAIERIRSRGRLVMAGDHRQLGPILTGTYPDPVEGEPILHGSIFDLLKESPGRIGAPICQLIENWRMCDVLTGASRILYGPDYKCATVHVAGRRLCLNKQRKGFVGACLDPNSPMVIAILSGFQAARVNEVEAGLVSRLAVALRDDLDEVETDEEFWRKRLFIVSPHHAQIRAIRVALSQFRDWSVRPFVDTVDKMQGQEADAVLISYGVADPEYAAMEAEFIYGRNRLNVALTRARVKGIIFLPKPLIDASPEVLDSPPAAEGLAYMRNLVQLARSLGTTNEFELSDGATVEVLGLGDVFSGI